jgi:HemY protein
VKLSRLLLVYFPLLAGLLFVALYFAYHPGGVTLNWLGYRIDMHIGAALFLVALLFLVLQFLAWLFGAILRTPQSLSMMRSNSRKAKGYRALTRGLTAVAAGDPSEARRQAKIAHDLLGEPPLTLLLAAQAAQLAGEGTGARTAFEALAARPDTRILGLHGLFIEARRQGEREAARHFAEEAFKAAPRIGWAGTALFEYQSQAGDWQGALQTLSSNADAKVLDKAAARRLRAVLLTARAMELESGEPDEARVLALEAHRLAPDLVPASVTAGRLLTRSGDIRRATKVLEAGWKAFPHPEIAEAYAAVRPGDSVRDRLKRMRRLADLRANHPEGAVAIARAAIDAREWTAAREALEGLVRGGPTERVCMLMAEIEEGENGDQGRVRSWLTRAFSAPPDPAWVADGQAFDRWAPVSPISGRVDAFAWKVAAQTLGAMPRAEIESEAPAEILPSPAVETRKAEAKKDVPVILPPKPGSGLTPESGDIVATAAAVPAPKAQKAKPPKPPPKAPAALAPREMPAILPRAPDDPGPEPATADPDRPGFPRN